MTWTVDSARSARIRPIQVIVTFATFAWVNLVTAAIGYQVVQPGPVLNVVVIASVPAAIGIAAAIDSDKVGGHKLSKRSARTFGWATGVGIVTTLSLTGVTAATGTGTPSIIGAIACGAYAGAFAPIVRAINRRSSS